ncbi:Rne/Rng family ribonuclease [Planktotalea arctica]|uniref:Rne/Rng family ribonuclease n=1 Tax=Planktotalea arctica TaxID=1481893 RepID=UPI000A173C69|nr:ribonuclease E/G [Planktotalea arctica]
MPKKMLIDATHAEETRVVVVDGNKVEEFDFESENKRQLAGNIYLAKVTRVEPSLQAAFVDYGGNRHGFLAFSEIHPDYYQIPVADREALMEEERAYAESQRQRDEEQDKPKPRRSRRRSTTKAADATNGDAVISKDVDGADSDTSAEITGMETIDLSEDAPAAEVQEGSSPMETVAETPVETPSTDETELDGAVDEDDASDIDVAAHASDDEDTPKGQSAADRDENIESVADDDDVEDIRPARKPRPRRYKIQEVVKVRQILLVQVVKEERGNKGAALTTYLSLAGRYCVLMPNTARGGGISRKITNVVDRKKLKEIANEIDVPQGAGLIVRTAGAKRTKTEIKRDYEYLQRLWEQIRELTLKSIAPAKIYEEGDLIKRSIRDLYNRDIDEVFVEGERGYRIAKDFMKMIMPSHAKNVKLYNESMPLFARYQVESYLAGMFNPTVQLRSGGYIVIDTTEALVAVDVNSGRATKEGSIEQTATKTNLEAAEEVARQVRLRDLAGLIVIDFIDMDERKNNAAVEKMMKDKLKTDRARIQVGRISGFGLMEMSRQRLRPGMIEATTAPCPSCHGTGLIRSDDNMALNILRQIEEEGVRRRSREVLVRCPVGICNYLMNQKREHIAQIELRYGLSVRIEGDPHMVSPDFALEKFKTATRVVPEPSAHVVSVDTSLMDQIDEDEAAAQDDEDEVASEAAAENNVANTHEGGEGDDKPKKRRRRRRRGGKKNNGSDGESGSDTAQDNADESESEEPAVIAAAPEQGAEVQADASEDAPVEKPKRVYKSRSRSKAKTDEASVDVPVSDAPVEAASDAPVEAEAAPEKPKRKPRARKPAAKKAPVSAPVTEAVIEPVATVAAEVTPVDAPATDAVAPVPEPAVETAEAVELVAAEAEVAELVIAEPEVAAPEAVETQTVPAEASEPKTVSYEPAKPKRRGWWSLGK